LGTPGGFINKRENLDEAAGRILKNRTGADIYLNQFKTFGDLDRSEGFFEEYG
jgi:ADP-ribose pyrophosphatase YjhB (NUDIX family)